MEKIKEHKVSIRIGKHSYSGWLLTEMEDRMQLKKMRELREARKWRAGTKILKTLKEADTTEIMPMAVIYRKPKEYPNNYVVRIFDGKTGRPTNLSILRKTLEECREDIKASGYSACFPRSRYDDPIIVESWL